MRRWLLTLVIVLVFAGLAPGASVIQYTLELGGDNQVAGWEAGDNPPFIAGDPADGKIASVGDVLTWDAVVEVSGTYDHDNDPGTPEIQSNGAANLVFTLELREWNEELQQEGDLVAEDVFFSTMNDGDAGGLPENDPLEMADFCHIYDVPCLDGGHGTCPGNGPHDEGYGGPGRLFDSDASGGPCLDRAQYPSTADHGGGRNVGGTYTAVGGPTSAPLGTLEGMSAGYSQFNPVANEGCAMAGVGISPYAAGLMCNRGLGHVPNFEGQIDTTALAPMVAQSYILKLIPGAGNNVLRGDFNCQFLQASSFAVPADEVLGDSIKFWVTHSDLFCAVTEWSSAKSHAPPCGWLKLSVAAGPSASIIETRMGGVTTIVVDFDQDVQAEFKTANDILITKVGDQYPPYPPGGNGSCFTVSSVAWPAADQMWLNLTPGTQSVACEIDLSNAFTCSTLTNPTCVFHNCLCNINYDVKTDLTDMALCKNNAIHIPPLPAPLRPDYDVNLDCKIDLTDMAFCKYTALGTPKVFCP